MFFSPRITDRDLAPLAAELARWRALEERLERFCAELRAERLDESDEIGATRLYVKRLARAGLLRLVAPGRHGGETEAISSTATCLARQWLARESGALDSAFVMQGLGSHPLALGASEALQAQVFPRVVTGDAICAFAITEPDAGSDVGGMTTLAHPVADGGVRISGRKCFISNAPLATSYVVFAREGVDTPDGKPRYGAFWLPGDAPGLSVTPTQVTAPHPIGTVEFDDVFIPPEHRIGAPGDGLKIALENLDVFRPTVGAAALGFADRALDEAVTHVRNRVQFGRPLAKQQGLRFMLAERATDHLAAQLLVYRAATARDRGDAGSDHAAMAKLFATESAQRMVDTAVQCLGGLGVTVGNRVEALYREVRALRIYEGTSEIQKLIVARALLDPSPPHGRSSP